MAKCWQVEFHRAVNMGGRIIEPRTFHGWCTAGNSYGIAEVQSSERRAGLCMDVRVQMLTVNCFPSKAVSAGIEISSEVEIVNFFIFRKTRESLRLKKGRRAGRTKHWREAGRLERTLHDKQKERKIARDSMARWLATSCGRVSKQLPFPSSLPHLVTIYVFWGVCFVLF